MFETRFPCGHIVPSDDFIRECPKCGPSKTVLTLTLYEPKPSEPELLPNQEGLKPCPFCGGTNILPHIGDGGCNLECQTCDFYFHEDDHAAAIVAWNRRAPGAEDGHGLTIHEQERFKLVQERDAARELASRLEQELAQLRESMREMCPGCKLELPRSVLASQRWYAECYWLAHPEYAHVPNEQDRISAVLIRLPPSNPRGIGLP